MMVRSSERMKSSMGHLLIGQAALALSGEKAACLLSVAVKSPRLSFARENAAWCQSATTTERRLIELSLLSVSL